MTLTCSPANRSIPFTRDDGFSSDREVAVPGDKVVNRWSVDLMFLDQDGIPTIVETKLCANTEIRRKVVGQLLDYAANATVHWPVNGVRSAFEARHSDHGDNTLQEVLGGKANTEKFWDDM